MQKTVLTLGLCVLALAACGKKEVPPAALPTPGAATPSAEPAAAGAQNDLGKGVYAKTCAMCHSAGVAGAPKPGDKADWGPRIAQGMDVVYKHAIEGFTGGKGMMPPRGGGTALTDEQVKAAVDFMVNQSK
ncbi:c-type cytochrome [Inhella gelatinilytica]|uniref:Cytochrome c5 family protein n=1 Tax=Inhella gelatinilytica TaxID=2795030 RepID=A0A931NCR5_9BURK|nr:c-type cytochrome [Inhella gelatinilytica]MBH9552302.1 cytochrome c5 family protein [Inhella gelatinilytica]